MVPGVPSDSSVMKPHTTGGSSLCDNCKLDDRWILHNVHRNKSLSRLCTSCVFRLHTVDFCTICFSLHGPDKPSSTPLLCIKCKSTAHPDCLAPLNIPKSPYLCPICLNPNSKIFDFPKPNPANPTPQNHSIDLRSAKALRIAAIIAAKSLHEAADRARLEAEKKAKEAVFAKKKAKEDLDRVGKVCSDIDAAAFSVANFNAFKPKSQESFHNNSGSIVERKDGIVVNKVINALPSAGSSQNLQKNK